MGECPDFSAEASADVDITVPDIALPDIEVPDFTLPDIDVDVDVDARPVDTYVHMPETGTAMAPVAQNSDMWIGDTAATTWVWRYLYNNGMKQEWNKPEDRYGCEWNEERWDEAFMNFFMQLWFGLVFIRIYYNIVIMKWCNEAGWIKTASDDEAADSHPCRPTVCCQGICM